MSFFFIFAIFSLSESLNAIFKVPVLINSLIPLISFKHMCYDLTESVRSQEHWLRDIASKRNGFLLFSTVLRIQVGFPAKCTPSNEHLNQIENWKCHMFDFRLISLDRITYGDFGTRSWVIFRRLPLCVKFHALCVI